MPMVGDIYTGIIFGGRGTRGADLNDFVIYVSNASRATFSSRYGLMNNACVTQAEYDALPVKDANTLYFIVPEPMEGSRRMSEGSTRRTMSPGMASYCGSISITRIYCGSTQVIRVYCGTQLTFGTAP